MGGQGQTSFGQLESYKKAKPLLKASPPPASLKDKTSLGHQFLQLCFHRSMMTTAELLELGEADCLTVSTGCLEAARLGLLQPQLM